MKIPYFRPWITNEDKKEVKKVLDQRWLTNGPILKKFEAEFSKFQKTKFSLGVSSATHGLHLCLKAIGIKPGDEVIVPTMTFAATADVVTYCGAKPVLVDIDEDTLNISTSAILDKINKKTKAIIPVHYGGQSCDMDKIQSIANKFKLKIVEDCAHALGSTYNGKKCGSIGDISCFSFYPTKIITTGEGGMITTNSSGLVKKVNLLRSHGMNHLPTKREKSALWNYDIVDLGYNYRLDEIRATLGLSQLKKIQLMNKKRRNAFKYYNKFLKNIPGVSIPSEKDLNNHACHLYVLRILKNKFPISRNQLFKKLLSAGIRTTVHYKPLNKFLIYRKLGLTRDKLVNSNKLYDEIISLPLYPDIKKQEQDIVIKTISLIQKKI